MSNTYDRPTVPNPACHHKVADHWHGTHVCYALDPCRCSDCSAANARYERSRAAWLAGARPHPYVDADPARAHVVALVAAGMGVKRIAKVSGVPRGSLSRLVYGDYARQSPPSKRIRRATEAKLLATTFDLADGARVDGTEAKAIVAELVARGWTKAEIGRRVTGKPATVSLQSARFQTVTAGTLRTLRSLMDEDVPVRIHSRWGTPIKPKAHRPQVIKAPSVPVVAEAVAAPIPTVPAFADRAKGKLRCGGCGQALATHPMSWCA